MSRVIVAAAAAFALVALVLHRAVFTGRFAEPVLLFAMGTLFLIASRLAPAHDEAKKPAPAPVLVPREQRA